MKERQSVQRDSERISLPGTKSKKVDIFNKTRQDEREKKAQDFVVDFNTLSVNYNSVQKVAADPI